MLTVTLQVNTIRLNDSLSLSLSVYTKKAYQLVFSVYGKTAILLQYCALRGIWMNVEIYVSDYEYEIS